MKNTRGKASGKWLQLFTKHNPNVKLPVPVNEDLNALCGEHVSRAAHLLGMHIRQRCPVRNTRHWQDVDPGTQEVIIQAVLVIDHFNWVLHLFPIY